MGIAKILFVFAICVIACSSVAEDWPKYRRDLNNSGLSLGNLKDTDVSSLMLKWSLQLGGAVTASPAVATINGTSMVFVGSWNGVFYGINAVTGQKIWSFQIDIVSPCSTGNCRIASSASVTNGIVYFGAENAFLYALNATTGALVWKQQLADPSIGYEIWSSPAVYNGVVYVGLASHDDDPCVVGQVVARNASTGAPVWSFSTIDQTTCSGNNCVGGEVHASPVLDIPNGVLYVGTGHPGSACLPSTADATKYPDSIVALKMADGQLLNYYQTPSTASGNGFYSSPVLFYTEPFNCTLPIHYWVGEASENGSLYDVQRGGTGLITSTVKSLAVDPNGFRASPALHVQVGGGLGCTVNEYLYLASGNGSGGTAYMVLQQDSGTLGTRWTNPVSFPTPMYSAPTASVDIEFVGSNDGRLYVLFSGQGGGTLWSYATGGAVESSPALSGATTNNYRVYFGSDDGFLRCLSINGQ